MDLGAHNKAVFGAVAQEYDLRQQTPVAFLNRAEQVAFMSAADRGRDVPVLDVGAGAGRTTSLLRLISDDYTAVDYAPAMVAAFRRNFPRLTADVADARDLSQFADGSFGLVVFSDNGLDTLLHDERMTALREFRRVVTHDGTLVFSTLNRDGTSFNEKPFQLKRPTTRWQFKPAHTGLRWIFLLLKPAGIARGVGNWRRLRRLQEDHDSWAMGPLKAHDFAPFVHFTTTRDLHALLAATGWEAVSVLAEDGADVDLAAHTCSADSLTIVARPVKRLAAVISDAAS